MKKSLNIICLTLFVSAVAAAQAPKPKHINKAIELLAQGQPISFLV